MDDVSGKWKSNLLSSGVPLEFEVSKQLVRAGAAVFADYAYLRRDGAAEKEFTVDLYATLLTSFRNDGHPMSALDVLVECKHRHRNTMWLFLPRHKPAVHFKGVSESVIRTIDQFSPWFARDVTLPIDQRIQTCSKGVEIDINSNHVHDSEIRHGLAQLQFALPTLLASRLRTIGFLPAGMPPIFFTPILVTNAPLYVASRRLSVSTIERADKPQRLGRRVPFLVVEGGAGPELERHAMSVFSDLPRAMGSPVLRFLEDQLKDMHVLQWHLPSEVARRAAIGAEWRYDFRRILICNKAALPVVLRELSRGLERVVEGMSKEPLPHMCSRDPAT